MVNASGYGPAASRRNRQVSRFPTSGHDSRLVTRLPDLASPPFYRKRQIQIEQRSSWRGQHHHLLVRRWQKTAIGSYGKRPLPIAPAEPGVQRLRGGGECG